MKMNTLLIAGVLIIIGSLVLQSHSQGSANNRVSAKSGFDNKHIFRELQFVIHNRNADEYFREFLHTPLKYFLPGTDKVAGVETTITLTKNEFPEVGSVRQVVLKNGETAREEVTELQSRYFKYKVTGYTTKQAEPLEYGIGEFWFIPQSENTIHVRWRYSFKLRENKFPGSFGYVGRRLFKWMFVDGDWAEYMDASVQAIRAHAEGNGN